MTTPSHPRSIVLRLVAGLTALALLVTLLILPAAPQNAQAQGLRHTPSSGGILGGGTLPTRGAPALNLTPGGLSTLAAGAAEVLSNPAYPEVAATAEALMTQAAGIAGGASSDVLATAEALATQAYVDLPAIQATAAYIATAAVEYDWDALAAEALTALEDVLSTANVTYNPEDGSLLITTLYSEAMINALMINALLDASLVATGLNPEQVNVDLIPGGLILTVSGYTAGQTIGTLVIQAAAGITNGELTYSIVAVTFNGAPLPAAWMAEVEALFADVPLETVMIEELIGELSAYGEVSYQVEDLLVTDTELYLTVSVWFVMGG